MENNSEDKSLSSNTPESMDRKTERFDKMQEKSTDKRKQSLYFPEDMLTEIKREALRQDRSLSWIVQQAWRIAKDEIKKFPSINIDSDVVEE